MPINLDDAARALALRVRATGRGFLTLRRDELRDALGIGRLTDGLIESVCGELNRQEIFIFPPPFPGMHTLRLYDRRHPIAGVAETIADPSNHPETPLRSAVEAFARESAGRDLRSDDAPWPIVFDLFLLSVLGREPEGWEELRDDRHPIELARELGHALGLPPAISSQPSTLRVAAAVCAFRPKKRRWRALEFVGHDAAAGASSSFCDALSTAERRAREEHDRLLRHAARLLMGCEELPTRAVELGLLGLRYRREDDERNAE